MSTLLESVEDRLSKVDRLLNQFKAEPRLDLIGRVERVGDNVASVCGLPEARLGELLLFERSDGGEAVVGIVLSLDPDLIGCAMLGETAASGRAIWCARPVQSPVCRWVTSCWAES